MEFRVLGPIEALHGGVPLALGGPKQRSVLALLVASAGRPVSVGVLIEGVYGEDATDGARRTIHTYVSNLRREVGDVITRAGDGYLLNSADVDAVRFEALYRAGSAAVADDPTLASAQLREALALWRGHAYADVEGRSQLDAEITRLEELRLSAIDARIEADLALGLHRDLIGELEALSAEHPLRESFRAHHMLALYRAGRQSEALRAFGRTRTLLAEELGIDPSPTLQEMEEAILTQDPKLDVRIKAIVETRAILAAELDDALSFQSIADRDAAFERRDAALVLAASAQSGQMLGVSGSAAYAWFPDVAGALAAATALPLDLVRVAVDHGEVEVGERGVVGAPVVRALRLAAVAHPGQVLISADAQSHLAAGSAGGWALKSLGRYSIRGLDATAPVFQLIVRGVAEEFPELLLDRLPPPMPGTGVGIPGFELRGEVGGGTVGVLHRAYQPSVGREVAVRVIRPELVSDPRFIRRFEAETQRIAGIEHPHLVPLLDHWREPTAAYLVYRLMRGGDLRTLIDTAPPSLEVGIDAVEKVGAALHAAHGAGVVHGRVRPENILFDRESNPHLADLGVAAMFEGLAAFPADAYTAPETIHGHPTVAADVYSLGAVTAELLSGHVLPVDRGLPSVGEAVDRVIARATHPDPDLRHSTVLAFLEDLASAIPTRFPGAPIRSGTVNPYRGLATFREADAAHFFGRSALVDTLAATLADRSLILVVGPSGIGKSSVVRAGLVPALRRGVLPGSESWLVVDFFPGSRPFEELESALDRVAVTPSGEAVEDLRCGRCGLETVVERVLPTGSRLMLVVDQFEELWTHLADDNQRRRFLGILTEVAFNPVSAVKVVATMRADFYDRPLQHAGFGEVAAGATVAVPVPTDAELAEIVRGPAAAVRVNVTDELVDAMVADAGKEPGALPLVQYVLTEMFDNREFDLLDIGDYREAGGLVGSIGRRAEHIHLGFSPEERQLARDVFVRLVTVDEDSEDTRRRVRRSELELLGGGAALDRILEAFGRHRLLVFDRDAATRGPTVEVAHEALLSQWDRLAGWIDEARHDLLTRRRIEIAAREWAEAGADPSYLLGGARLELAEAWASGSGMHVSADEAAYLAESRRVADVERMRRRRNRRRVTTSLTAALALAVAFGSFGWAQRGVAEREAITARMQELAVEAEAAIGEDPDLAILLALEAYELSEQVDLDRTPGAVMRALQVTSQASRLMGSLPHGRFAATLSPDGTLLALDDPTDRQMIHIYDTSTLTLVHSLPGGGPVGALAFSPDGTELAVSFEDDWGDLDPGVLDGLPGVQLFDVSTWQETRSFDDRLRGWNIDFSESGRYLAVNGYSGAGIRTESSIIVDDVDFVRWIPGGDVAAVLRADEAVIEILDPTNLTVSRSVPVPGIVVLALDVKPDLERLLVVDDVSDRVLEMNMEGEILSEFDTPGAQYVSYSSDGSGFVAQGNDDRVLYVSDAGAVDLRGHGGGSWTTVLSQDRSRLYALLLNGGTKVWDVTVEGQPALGSRPLSPDRWFPMWNADATQLGLAYEDPDGRRLEVLDPTTGQTLAEPVALGPSQYVDVSDVFSIRALPDTIRLDQCERVVTEGGSPASVAILNECDDTEFLRVVHIDTGVDVARLPVEGGGLFFGPAGTIGSQFLVFNPVFGPVDLIRVSDGETVGVIAEPDTLFVPAFASDGRTLSVGSVQGVLTVVDLEAVLGGTSFDEATKQLQDGFGPTNYTTSGAHYVVSSRSGDVLRFRDRDTREMLFDIPISTLNFVPMMITRDDRYLYYRDLRGEDSVLRRMPLQTDELVALAGSLTTRDFTVEECERFLIDTDCSVYEET